MNFDDLIQMTVPQLETLKDQWAKQALEDRCFQDAKLVVLQLGQSVTLPRRESYDVRFWCVPHPMIPNCFIKATFYQHVTTYNVHKKDWNMKKVLIVFVGKDKQQWSGKKVLCWDEENERSSYSFIPGNWFGVFRTYLTEASRIFEEKQAAIEDEKKSLLLDELEPFGEY